MSNRYRFFFEPTNIYFDICLSSKLKQRPETFFSQNQSSVVRLDPSIRQSMPLVVTTDKILPVPEQDPIINTPIGLVASSSEVVADYHYAVIKYKSNVGSELIIHPDTPSVAPQFISNLSLTAFRHAALYQSAAVLHAAAFSYANLGFIIEGDSKSGKSTFCIQANTTGAEIISDDMIIVNTHSLCEQNIIAYAARTNFTLRQDIAEMTWGKHLSVMRKIIIPATSEIKYVIPRKSNLLKSKLYTPLHCILFSDGIDPLSNQTHFTPLSLAQFYARLMACSHPMFAGSFSGFETEDSQAKQLISNMLNGLSGFSVTMGTDILNNPDEVLNRLVDKLSEHS